METKLDVLFQQAKIQCEKEYKEILQEMMDNNDEIFSIINYNGSITFMDEHKSYFHDRKVQGLSGYGDLLSFLQKWGNAFRPMDMKILLQR